MFSYKLLMNKKATEEWLALVKSIDLLNGALF